MDRPVAAARKPLYRSLYFQVICAIVIGVLLGHFYPSTGEAMKPLGDGFIELIKMIIAPIIFCTFVLGIAGMEDMKKVGKTGGYALLYFEVVSSVALVDAFAKGEILQVLLFAILFGFALHKFGVILGIDRFMSEARALTNLVGNGVATVVGKWCGELDSVRMRQVLNRETEVEADEPERVLDRTIEHPAAA